MVSDSAISWTICKSASCLRQHPTTQFLWVRCPSCHPTNSDKALISPDVVYYWPVTLWLIESWLAHCGKEFTNKAKLRSPNNWLLMPIVGWVSDQTDVHNVLFFKYSPYTSLFDIFSCIRPPPEKFVKWIIYWVIVWFSSQLHLHISHLYNRRLPDFAVHSQWPDLGHSYRPVNA